MAAKVERMNSGTNSPHFALTPERIRQIEADALKKLRAPSRGRHLRNFLENGRASLG
jgi:hypothetical protein